MIGVSDWALSPNSPAGGEESSSKSVWGCYRLTEFQQIADITDAHDRNGDPIHAIEESNPHYHPHAWETVAICSCCNLQTSTVDTKYVNNPMSVTLQNVQSPLTLLFSRP